jgi:hypothetical protein
MKAFFRFEDSFAEEAVTHGLLPMSVSAFGHSLSSEEYSATPFVSYDDAKKTVHLPRYIKIEENFIRLLDALAISGVSRVYPPYKIRALNPASSKYRNIVKRGLRDKTADELYFHGLRARFVFNWDLTHWFFLRNEEDSAALAKLVRANGLHVLTESNR